MEKSVMKKITTIKEAVGVPTDIAKAAKNILNDFLEKLKSDPKSVVSDGISLDNEDGTYDFADMKVNNVSLEIDVEEAKQIKLKSGIEVDCVISGMAYVGKALHDDLGSVETVDTQDIKFMINVVTSGDIDYNRISKLIQNESESGKLYSVITHELKHAYDHFKKPKKSGVNLSRYLTFSQSRFGNEVIDDFVFKLYFMTKTEMMVRPSEVYADAIEKRISKKEFSEYLKKNDVYVQLKDISEYTYDMFRDNLKSQKDSIIEIFNSINEKIPDSDDKIIDRFLSILYITMTNRMIDHARAIITRGNPLALIFGIISDSQQEVFNNMVRELNKYENNSLKFFKDIIKKNQILAKNLIRKISKIYSLLENSKNFNYIDSFKKYNESRFNFFKKPIEYRQDMKVSKRMKENDIFQTFDKKLKSKEDDLTKSYLVYGSENKRVAMLEISSVDDYGRPLITLSIHPSGSVDKIIKRKVFHDQEKAIHYFLDYWESHTEEGKEKNKLFKLKRF